MEKKLIFSWAENADGKIVHVDEVPRGLQCGCSCPHCHERLMARHGDVRQHGFAHHSDNRGANLEICYMVTLYKLAEQIVQTKKRIYAPSVIAVKDGEILDFDDETAWDTKGYKTPEEYWENEDLDGLKKKLTLMFEETNTNICTTDCNK